MKAARQRWHQFRALFKPSHVHLEVAACCSGLKSILSWQMSWVLFSVYSWNHHTSSNNSHRQWFDECAVLSGGGVVFHVNDTEMTSFGRVASSRVSTSGKSNPFSFAQHRCVRIFTDKKTNSPTGFALGSIEGRVAIHYVNPQNPKDNFTYKCHRSNGATNGVQDIYAVRFAHCNKIILEKAHESGTFAWSEMFVFVWGLSPTFKKEEDEWGSIICDEVGICLHLVLQVNDIAFHPVHGTLATVGSDGRFSFWDKDARTKLKTSDQFDQPITTCSFNAQGNIFGYASSYDWSKVQCSILLRNPLASLHINTRGLGANAFRKKVLNMKLKNRKWRI